MAGEKECCESLKRGDFQVLLTNLEILRHYKSFVHLHFGSMHEALYTILEEYEKEGAVKMSRWPKLGFGREAFFAPKPWYLNKTITPLWGHHHDLVMTHCLYKYRVCLF